MPLTWSIDHEARRVDVTVEGNMLAADVRDYLAQIAEAGAMPYAKLFDASEAKGVLSIDELKGLGSMVRQFAVEGLAATGPLAIVVGHSGLQLQAAHFADSAGSNRPLQIFRSKAEAERWLRDQRSRSPRR